VIDNKTSVVRKLTVLERKVPVKKEIITHRFRKEIGDRRQVEDAKTAVIARLKETLSQVKTLQGFLPIPCISRQLKKLSAFMAMTTFRCWFST
jgi:hypothetical protein